VNQVSLFFLFIVGKWLKNKYEICHHRWIGANWFTLHFVFTLTKPLEIKQGTSNTFQSIHISGKEIIFSQCWIWANLNQTNWSGIIIILCCRDSSDVIHPYKIPTIVVYGHCRSPLPCFRLPCWFFAIRGWKISCLARDWIQNNYSTQRLGSCKLDFILPESGKFVNISRTACS